LTFDAVAGGHHVLIDGGPGFGDGRGPTPMQLLLVSLAGCTAMDVASILQKSRQPVSEFNVRIEAEQVDKHPKRYSEIEMVFEVHGNGVDRKAVERAVQLSTERYCSVQATLTEAPVITSRIDIVVDGES
jgi:putative redox protein